MGDAVETCEPEQQQTQYQPPQASEVETPALEPQDTEPQTCTTDTTYFNPSTYGTPDLEQSVPAEPAEVARGQLEQLEQMPDADKTAALKNLTPEDKQRLMADLPEEERVRLVDLAQHSDDPNTKLDLFMAGQRAKVNQDANAELDDQMDPELASQMEERRKKIADSTMKELEEEEARLREKGENMSEQDVKDMIARKTKEHDLEMSYNVNLTASGETREQSWWEAASGEAPGALDGKRVEWTKDELDTLDLALRQAPDGVARNNPNLEEITRVEKIDGANADHNPENKTIRLADVGIYDDKGAIKNDEAREGNIDPSVKAEGGKDTKFMEWVVLHELGHNNHDFANSEAYEQYAKNMQVYSVEEDNLEYSLDEGDVDKLKDGKAGTRLEAYGFTYVKQEDGTVKKFPSALYENADADPDTKEYFAQHHNQAILAPESTAKEYLDDPQARLDKAGKDIEQAKKDREAVVASGGDTTELDQRLEDLQEEQRHARINQRVWKKEYDVMRNKVFHADDAEKAARERMKEDGYDTKEFDEQVGRLSTPDQVARLEEELRQKQDNP